MLETLEAFAGNTVNYLKWQELTGNQIRFEQTILYLNGSHYGHLLIKLIYFTRPHPVLNNPQLEPHRPDETLEDANLILVPPPPSAPSLALPWL